MYMMVVSICLVLKVLYLWFQKVLQFVMGHMDVFATILSDHQEAVNVAYLQELALVTAVISRAAVDGLYHYLVFLNI